MRPCLALALLIVTFGVIAGCVDDDTGTQPHAPGKARPTVPKTGAARFDGALRDRYDEARAACGAKPPRRIARDLGLSTRDPYAIAQALIEKYPPPEREAVFDGCLAGLPAR